MSQKPTRDYYIATGPVGIPHESGVTILVPAQEHQVRGCEVKGLQVADMGYFQIVNSQGSVVFCAPAHTILWCSTEGPMPDERKFAIVRPIKEENPDVQV